MNIRYSILFLTLITGGLLSCKNNDSVIQPPLQTGLNVVNATGDTLNFYVNGTRQNGLSPLYPGGNIGLLLIPSGLQNYQFKKAGSSNVLLSTPQSFTFNTLNSIYVTGESADKVFKTLDTLPLIDTFKFTTGLRFVNAAPDAGNLDVYVGDTVKIRTRPYKSSSIFLLTGSGQKRVRVYLSGATTARLDTTMAFQSNTDYTLFTKGLLNGKGNAAFNVRRLINTR
ncbi:MAG: hypothetical protein NVSMB24_01040 [Mucilaginibacter sp.]